MLHAGDVEAAHKLGEGVTVEALMVGLLRGFVRAMMADGWSWAAAGKTKDSARHRMTAGIFRIRLGSVVRDADGERSVSGSVESLQHEKGHPPLPGDRGSISALPGDIQSYCGACCPRSRKGFRGRLIATEPDGTATVRVCERPGVIPAVTGAAGR